MRAKMPGHRYRTYRSDRNPRRSRGFRFIWLSIGWTALFVLVVVRLVQVQVIHHDDYLAEGKRLFQDSHELQAQRGTIYDRNGEKLAVDLIHYSIAINPQQVEDPERTARILARFLKKDYHHILKILKSDRKFAYLAHKQPPEVVDSLKAYRIKGLDPRKFFRRYYPFRTLAAQVLGFCDLENVARAGLEKYYDHYLNGKPGWSVFLRDPRGRTFPDLDYPISPPINGMSIQTTLDMVFQSILEDELARGVTRHQADRGSAILMNPATGEILAMANYPGYDPNQYFKYPIERFRNTAISYLYDPGSTFKMVSLAYILEQMDVDLDQDIVYCENGRYRLFGRTIRDHEPYGWLTIRQVFERSSNIGILKLAEKFKDPVFYRYARDFGFGVRTGIDLPAEARGILHNPEKFTRSTKYYMGIGYEVAVTPLQVASAYAAVANGGRLMRPFIVRRILGPDGEVFRERTPQVIRQVISPETADYIRNVLQGVVERGTGQNARVAGLSIAGKTGTSQRWNREKNQYSSDSHVASFVGFFPAEQPRFVLMVVIFNPRNGYYGSQVAAPVFRNIARRVVGLPVEQVATVQKMSLSPAGDEPDNPIPRLANQSLDAATAILKRRNIPYEVIGNGAWVERQKNIFSRDGKQLQKIVLITGSANLITDAIMPSLKGLTLKEALQKLSGLNVEPEVEGYGVVVQQYPQPGKPIKGNKRIKLVCKPA